MKSSFSSNLRRLREQSGLTPETLAERAGLHGQAVRKLESGERAWPRLDTVLRLARGLRIDPEILLKGLVP